MKKLTFVVFVILAMLFLAGCSAEKTAVDAESADDNAVVEPEPAEPYEPEPVADESSTEPRTVVVEPETDSADMDTDDSDIPVAPTVVEEEVAETGTLSKEVKELLGKADSKLKSYSYYYPVPPANQAGDIYTIKGTKIKVYRPGVEEFEGEWFDTIYFDTALRTATAYCEDTSQFKRCTHPDKEVQLPYSKYLRKTPYQWIKEVKYAEKAGQEQIESRDVTILHYRSDGNTIKMWVDEFYGIPLQIAIIDSEGVIITHEFRDLVANSVKDEDLEHPEGGRDESVH